MGLIITNKHPALMILGQTHRLGSTGFALRALHPYNKELRNLILSAKVQTNHLALYKCQELLLKDPFVREWANWAEALIPVPSSFWSRIRGRFDVAYALTHELSLLCKRPLQPPPWPQHWQWRKRVHQRPKSSDRSIPLPTFKPTPHKRLLVIDDIVTTGHSLQKVAYAFGTAEIRLIALADALGSK